MKAQTLFWSEEIKLGQGAANIVTTPEAFSRNLPSELIYRRVYFAGEAKRSVVGDYLVRGVLEFLAAGVIVGEVPVSYGECTSGATTFKASAACGGSMNTGPAGQDSIALALGRQFTLTDRQILLTPFRLVTSADRMRLSITEVVPPAGGQITQLVMWIGIASSSHKL